jgi:hypothetical protein
MNKNEMHKNTSASSTRKLVRVPLVVLAVTVALITAPHTTALASSNQPILAPANWAVSNAASASPPRVVTAKDVAYSFTQDPSSYWMMKNVGAIKSAPRIAIVHQLDDNTMACVLFPARIGAAPSVVTCPAAPLHDAMVAAARTDALGIISYAIGYAAAAGRTISTPYIRQAVHDNMPFGSLTLAPGPTIASGRGGVVTILDHYQKVTIATCVSVPTTNKGTYAVVVCGG